MRTNPWTAHLSKFRASHPHLSLKESMQLASPSYRGRKRKSLKKDVTRTRSGCGCEKAYKGMTAPKYKRLVQPNTLSVTKITPFDNSKGYDFTFIQTEIRRMLLSLNISDLRVLIQDHDIEDIEINLEYYSVQQSDVPYPQNVTIQKYSEEEYIKQYSDEEYATFRCAYTDPITKEIVTDASITFWTGPAKWFGRRDKKYLHVCFGDDCSEKSRRPKLTNLDSITFLRHAQSCYNMYDASYNKVMAGKKKWDDDGEPDLSNVGIDQAYDSNKKNYSLRRRRPTFAFVSSLLRTWETATLVFAAQAVSGNWKSELTFPIQTLQSSTDTAPIPDSKPKSQEEVLNELYKDYMEKTKKLYGASFRSQFTTRPEFFTLYVSPYLKEKAIMNFTHGNMHLFSVKETLDKYTNFLNQVQENYGYFSFPRNIDVVFVSAQGERVTTFNITNAQNTYCWNSGDEEKANKLLQDSAFTEDGDLGKFSELADSFVAQNLLEDDDIYEPEKLVKDVYAITHNGVMKAFYTGDVNSLPKENLWSLKYEKSGNMTVIPNNDDLFLTGKGTQGKEILCGKKVQNACHMPISRGFSRSRAPTKKAAAPAKKAAAPAKKAAAPAKKAAPPAKKAAPPAKKAAPPTKKAAPPAKKAAAPTKKAAPPTKKAAPPTRKHATLAKKPAPAAKKPAPAANKSNNPATLKRK